MTTTPTTCTVVVRGDGTRCGQPAVTTFTSSRTGDTFAECAMHVMSLPTSHPKPSGAPLAPANRSTRAYVLVRDGKIVGYSESNDNRAIKRAARLGATLIPNNR